MKEPGSAPADGDGVTRGAVGDAEWLRWALPAGLLAAEFGALTLVGSFPSSGPATALVPAIRTAMPVVFAATASAWLMTRRGALLSDIRVDPAPPWRPWPSLTVHAIAFAATAVLTHRLLGEGAPPVSLGGFAAWLACVAVTSLLALGSAAPLRWTYRRIAPRWRVPVLALSAGLLTWRAMALVEGSWGILSQGTLRAASWLLRGASNGVTVDLAEHVIALDGFGVEVTASCSGVDGIGLVLLFQAIWIALARRQLRVGRALLILPLGAIAALLGNVLRISSLLLLGASGRGELALGAFHSKIGWLFFIAIALASTAAAERAPWLQRSGETAGDRAEMPASAGAYVAPLVGAVGTAFVCRMLSASAVDHAYSARVTIPILILFLVRRSLPAPRLSWSWVAALIGVATGALWALGVNGSGGALALELSRMTPAARWGWIAARTLGSTLVIPLVEELAFRGFLLPWLTPTRLDASRGLAWSWPAAAVSSLAFGMLHEHWLAGTLAGLAFAAARVQRDRLGDAILAHAACNAAVAAAVLLGGRWDLWA